MGVIHFAGSTRVGIDPLALDYMRSFNFSTRGVHLMTSMGEHLPLASNSFDVVIIGNVLDHVNEPGLTLDEIHRVLKPEGEIILWMHVIPRWLVPARKILDMIDGGHPYHMTEAEAYALIRRSQLEPVQGQAVAPGLGWRAGWKAALANLAMRNLLVKGRAMGKPAAAAAS
jgi:ubiquinone/menaquinone biosynthesis C-methylase UbiE